MWHGKSRRRISGGKVNRKRKPRKHELGREALPCKVAGSQRRKTVDVRGKREKKQRLQFASKANLTDPETGETSQEDVKEVLENSANPRLARRDIITKGAIIRTSGGNGRVTSRPGQSGLVNAIKVEE